MGNKQFARDPLLYIQQPSIQVPEAPMQHNYYTPKKESKTVENESKQTENVYTRALKRPRIVKSDNDGGGNEELSESDILANQSKFKDMTLKQKVSYFVDKPSHAPVMRCEIKTDEQTYQGIISDSVDDHVFIRVGRRSSSTKIPFDEIISVRMLGF